MIYFVFCVFQVSTLPKGFLSFFYVCHCRVSLTVCFRGVFWSTCRICKILRPSSVRVEHNLITHCSTTAFPCIPTWREQENWRCDCLRYYVFLLYDYKWLISARLDAYYFISTVILNWHAGNMGTDVEAVLIVIQLCVYLSNNQ